MPARIFCDTSVLIRYFAEDDPPRALAAARLFDSDATLVVSTTALLELVQVLRTSYGVTNPRLGEGLVRFLTRDGVELVDATRARPSPLSAGRSDRLPASSPTPSSGPRPSMRAATPSPPSTSAWSPPPCQSSCSDVRH